MKVCRTAFAACVPLFLLMVSVPAQAQYLVRNLVSNQVDDHASNVDPLLANSWGLARGATSPWWVSDNLSGWATIYDGAGTPQGLRVLIPTAGDGPISPDGLNGPGSPTGIVSNESTDFQIQGQPANFIFATLDGTISAWAFGVNKNRAIIEMNNSASKAVYTGLAITKHSIAPNFLYAADNANNRVDMFDGNFNFVKSFGDPSIPSNFSVFGIQIINDMVYVTYAGANGSAGGFIDVFKQDGTDPKILIQGPPLNQPWGMTLAPSNFGPLSNTLLVSNNAIDGTINGFNPKTGAFVGTISSQPGRKISFNQTWAIAFGGGFSANGARNELFVTAGPGKAGQNENVGIFASIVFAPIPDQSNQGGQH
ncbi:MAG TPA: TIGR03118 family protein [Candidatus Acidoferrales bacterium]|nr:TIGR03118 family protein [Candidatus Acidoferrales bacterium]